MKHRELGIIAGAAFIAAIFAFVLSGVLFGSPKTRPIKVPVVTTINSTFPIVQSDSDYTTFFNGKALDPTQLIQIGGNNNTAPFQNVNQQQ